MKLTVSVSVEKLDELIERCEKTAAVLTLTSAELKDIRNTMQSQPLVKPVPKHKKKSIFEDKPLAKEIMIARHRADRQRAVERIREQTLKALAESRKRR